jgi:hypothetical protein
MPEGFKLVIIEGGDTGKSFSFSKDSATIGRAAAGNDIILNDNSISGCHAKITFENGGYLLQDLKSTNKTYYRGSPLGENEKVKLASGDEFSLGKVVFRLYTLDRQETPLPGSTASGTRIMPGGEKKTGVLAFKQKPVIAAAAAVGILVILLLVVKLFFSLQAGPQSGDKDQQDNSQVPVPLPAQGVYGNNAKDRTHADKVIFTFAGQPGRASVYYTVGGIDSDDEVAILLNGKLLEYAPLAVNSWGQEKSIGLYEEKILQAGENRLVFDNTKNPPDRQEWGVKNVRIEILSGTCEEAESKRLYDLGETMFNERAVNEGNIYRAYQYYSQAAVKLDGCKPRPALLLTIEAKMKTSKDEIDTRYNNFMFSFKQSITLKKYEQAQLDLEAILRLMPDEKNEKNKEAKRLLKKLSGFSRQQ